jgi:peptidoglycan-associated lipoprotein
MNKVLSYSLHFVLIATMFLLVGCQQRQNRPTPDQTQAGMGPGSLEFGMPMDQSTLMFEPGSGLEQRGAGMFGGGEQIRNILQPIFFEFDRSTIGSSERNKAMAAAEHLRSNPGDRLLIEGHCDWRGTTEYNLGLGDRRASSVRDFLVSLGIDGSRIEVLSKGDLEATQGASDQQMARDRRAELVVLR